MVLSDASIAVLDGSALPPLDGRTVLRRFRPRTDPGSDMVVAAVEAALPR